MPSFQITGPDGKSYRVSGDTPEGAYDALLQHLGGTPAASTSDPRDGVLGTVDSFVRGAADTLSFGLADEFAAAADAAIGRGEGATWSERYDHNLRVQRGTDKVDGQKRPASRIAGQIVGGLTNGVGLARKGMSFAANAAGRGGGLGRVSAMSALDGGLWGGAQGFGSGEDGLENRAINAGIGGLAGGIVGGAAPGAVAGASALLREAAGPVMSRAFPDSYASGMLARGMKRADVSPQDIEAMLAAAQRDGQPMFNVADTMGHSGARMLSTVARNPNAERQNVVDALQTRQMGQGDRLSSFMAEAFGAPDTAAQRTASLTSARNAAADADYATLRRNIGDAPIWSEDLQALTSRPSVKAATRDVGNIAAERGYSVVNPFRIAENGTMELPEGVAPNFTFWDTVKRGVDRQIAADPTNRDIVATKNKLTSLLDEAVPGYAEARRPFMEASRAIDAVETGKAAASGRARAGDTVPAFSVMSPAEKSAFRAGYVDPYIAKLEASAISPSTNKARMLMTEKTGQEFPAFSEPGKAEQLGNRVAREQRMFDTANTALGGSKTADNLADAAELGGIDPSIFVNIGRKGLVSGLTDAILQGAGKLSGKTAPAVTERLARALMITDPSAVAAAAQKPADELAKAEALRRRIAAMILGMGSAGGGRVAGN